WRADQVPELPKLVDARGRRISSNDRSVDGTDRNARDPVRVQIRFSKGLVDAALVGAQRPAALKGQRDALEGKAPSAFRREEAGAQGLHRSVRFGCHPKLEHERSLSMGGSV